MRIIDITRPLERRTAVFPGDAPFSLTWTERLQDGAPVNLSKIEGSPHVGTHADAPVHVRDGAPGIDELPLLPFLGPARVVAAAPAEDGLLYPSVVAHLDLADPPRILFKTGTFPDTTQWNARYAAISPELGRRLGAAGVILAGIDTPSVDPSDSEHLPGHRALLEGGLCWLENLDLSDVEAGVYWLAALPLRIKGADGSPVRAVLIDGLLTT